MLYLFAFNPFYETIAITELDLLCLFQGNALPGGDAACKRPPSQGKHARFFNSTLAHQGDIGCAAADVNEDRSTFRTGVATQATCKRVRLRNNRDQRQV